MTKTVYRTFKNGEVIALFPEIPADYMGHFCLSYQSVGQHGAASTMIVRDTRPATTEEAELLKRELRALGYDDMKDYKRISYKMEERRRETARKF